MSKGKNITPNQRAMIKNWRARAISNRNGSGPLHIVKCIMDSTSYARILEDNFLPYY
uniref:HNH endonuclease n=1 Tax=Heterorhabditis bacteriophora TaxID=37862 RepID=A0A1I7XLB2_HETBA